MYAIRNTMIRASRGAAAGLMLAATGIASAQDLNSNAVEDSRDLRLGTSADCNLNGLVDERDAAAPHFTQAIEHLNALEGEQFQNNVWDARPIDFNQDGLSDMVVSSMYETNTGAITYWRNEGGAGLVYATRLMMPNARPYTLRVADLNGDALSDFVASDASFNRAYVFLATGAETFAPPVTLNGPASNNGSVGLDLGDLDNDGDLDIAFSTWYPAGIVTFINNGAGTFTIGATFATGAEPRDVAIGDVNGDGLADIASANQFYYNAANGTVSIHHNNGNNTFTLASTITMPNGVPPYNYQSEPQNVELIDVTGDGALDLVTSSNKSNVIAIHHNNGAGAFTLAQSLGGWWLESDTRDVIVADLDGDKRPEIAWGDVNMHMVSIYRNVKGTYVHHQNYASANYGGLMLTAADFSGDGLPDLVTTNNTSRTFCIMENKGGLVFDAAIQLRPTEFPGKGQLADYTSDGITDYLVTRSNYQGTIVYLSVYPGLGNADFAVTPIETQMPLPPNFILTRDINADGKPDILDVTGRCRVYLGNGDGTFAPPIESPIMPVGIRLVTGDVNLDGHMDLAWVWPGHPSMLQVSLGDGAGHFAPYAEYTDVAEIESVAIGDTTGDLYPEIMTGHRLGILSIHTNNGDGTYGTRTDITITATPLMPSIAAIAVADFNNDNTNDIVVSAVGLQMFFNPDDGDFTTAPPVTVAPYVASMLEVADIDLNGTPDLYGRSTRGIVYLNTQHDGFFDITMLLRHYDSNARTMVVADANNDGRQDLLIGPENSWSQYLFLNLPPAETDANGDLMLDSCQPFTPGDTNNDGLVTIADLLAVIGAWGACPAPPALCPQDVTGDGVVGITDLLMVIANWS